MNRQAPTPGIVQLRRRRVEISSIDDPSIFKHRLQGQDFPLELLDAQLLPFELAFDGDVLAEMPPVEILEP
ncbi:hypothetical protein KCV01_g960, partial [Aureobasidium melanogenum]